MTVRVTYVDTEGQHWRARTLSEPHYDCRPTSILVKRGPRLEVVEARYSRGREPGTWSRIAEPA